MNGLSRRGKRTAERLVTDELRGTGCLSRSECAWAAPSPTPRTWVVPAATASPPRIRWSGLRAGPPPWPRPRRRAQRGVHKRSHVRAEQGRRFNAHLNRRHQQRQDDGHQTAAHGEGIDVRRDLAGQLPGPDPLATRLSHLLQRWDMEQANGEVGLQAGQHSSGQRMMIDRLEQRGYQRSAPTEWSPWSRRCWSAPHR